jgi:Nucleoside-diphosphate-sugar pyrophosphorylase involved in lipopolysaccharide biosynthesis/translation initiation factor 2B, gamma/epsilon subunits (eIF-2Bgamma/eIF-2Bepsilon)
VKAFLLAAGKGERLLPYTQFLPKPLFPILGVPILEIQLKKLLKLGVRDVGINVFHLKEKILDFLNKYSQETSVNVSIFEEKKLLGTGGGIFNAKDFFTNSTLIINSDILFDFPLEILIEYHQKNKSLITLVCTSNSNSKNVKVDFQNNKVLSFRSKDSNVFYTGIQIVEPEIFEFLNPKFDLIDTYIEGLSHGLKISAIVVNDYSFIDIGTLSNYFIAHEKILLNKLILPELGKVESPFIIKAKGVDSKKVSLVDWVFIDEGCKLSGNTVLKKVIAWKGATIPEGIHEEKLFF